MPNTALPNYMQAHLNTNDMPPGHRFSLYFKVWEQNWKRTEKKRTALQEVTGISNDYQNMAKALYQRQYQLALQLPDSVFFPAESTAPFMTGIGNEHPIENGFAFLNPYGLPYLPGSSVKGVLRTVAEELALGLYDDTKGWDMLKVWWLFGFEKGSAPLSNKDYKDNVLHEEAERRRKAYKDWVESGNYNKDSLNQFIEMVTANQERKHALDDPQKFLLEIGKKDLSNQGALSFWDVYPQSKKMAVDILTPHHGGYFRGENSPHDSEEPDPIVFLTLPPKSEFGFFCTCTRERLPEALQQQWADLLKTAFDYSFDWLGFGAKTAVGYGQMKFDEDEYNKFIKVKEKSPKPPHDPTISPVEIKINKLIEENKDPNKKKYLVLIEALNAKDWEDENDKKTLLERIQQIMMECNDWRETTNKNPKNDKEYQRTVKVMELLKKYNK